MDEKNEVGGAGDEPAAERSTTRPRGARAKPDPVVEGAPVGESDEPVGAAGADESDAGIPIGTDAPVFSWVGVVTTAALGLVIVQALVFLGAVIQGISVKGFDGDFLHKQGVVYLSSLHAVNGVAILLAAVLAGLPALLRAEVSALHDRRRSLALSIGSFLSVALIVAAPIAVRARLRVLDLGNQEVDALARWVLATYTVSTLGTAAVALAACLGFARINKTVTPAP